MFDLSRGGWQPGGGDVTDEDYELLGLTCKPPPSSAEIRTAFRKQCMVWHPDLQGDKGEEEQRACQERFQRLVKAHERLRARHPDYLDGKR